MKKYYSLFALLASMLLLHSCNQDSGKAVDKAGENLAMSQVPPPDSLPNINLAGFRYPQDSSTIRRWIATSQQDSISLHGWGLWMALTSRANDTTYVFETWQTKQDVDTRIHTPAANQLTISGRNQRGRTRQLRLPSQFFHDPRLIRRLATSPANDPDKAVLEMVSYSPRTANTLVQNRLFVDSTLNGRLKHGNQGLGDFHYFGLAIKPMIQIVPGPSARGKARPYLLKVWNGPGTPAINDSFPPSQWPTYVLVDVLNRGRGKGKAQPVSKPVQDSLAITYNVKDFVHYRLTKAEADSLNADTVGTGPHPAAHPGDYAIVVGMHVTTSEINNWTWQTFWWTPNPDVAYAPSSAAVVAARPRQLTGAARHYAMSIGYQMLTPQQPYEGGASVGQSLYVYNPYLEAPFDSSSFNSVAKVMTGKALVTNNVGVRTNCMSCHMQATYAASSTTPTPGYIADAYIARGMPRFANNLRTAFLWSIPDMAGRKANQALPTTSRQPKVKR